MQKSLKITREKKTLINFNLPLSKVFEKAKIGVYLKPLTPKAYPNPLLANYHIDEYYDYHQGHGYTTKLITPTTCTLNN